MVATLHIRTFGGLSIALDEVPLHFDAHSAEALLVYLACQSRPLVREVLAEFLWPERTQEQARTNLRTALHRLRQQLDPYLLVTRETIALHLDARLDADCVQFEAHLAAGGLTAASALYAGDFLADFYLDGSPAFEQWALLERERLRTLAIAAFQQLIGQLAADGQADGAIANAQRLLQLDPLHEPTHRQLMRLLAQSGQRSAALTQYETCRQLLNRELNVLPDAATVATYDQIRSGQLRGTSDDLSSGKEDENAFVNPKSKIQSPKSHNLPLQSTPFIGREAELAQIDELLANPDCRLLSLLGVGGIGKTRLALEAAARQIDKFREGVCFVALAPVGALEFLLPAIAQSLNVTLTSEDVLAQLADYLYSRQLLLVLDNFEHLLPSSRLGDTGQDAADVVATLLRHAPRLKVVVTTRTRLQLLEEWLLPVDGFVAGDHLLGPAAQLFLRSAQRVQPAFTASGQGEAVSTICRQVGGMPLAIELAASWVRLMSCAEIAHQLAHKFDLLSTVVRNIPERHRSIRTLFEQSWRLLSPEEQAALRRLSVFHGGWTLAEAEHVLDLGEEWASDQRRVNGQSPLLNLLLALVDKSLVRSDGQNRYDLHELVRQYAAEQLTTSGEMVTVYQRHFAAYLILARAADAKLRGPEAAAWYSRLESEQSNVRAALRWALDHHHYMEVAWLGLALHWFWAQRVRWREAITWLEPTLTHAHAWPLDLRLANLVNLYNFWLGIGQQEAMEHHAGELMQLAQQCNNKNLHASALLIIGMSAPADAQAVQAYTEAIGLARQSKADGEAPPEFSCFSDTSYLLAHLLLRYGNTLRNRGEYAEATRLYQESLALFRAKGDCDTIADPLGNLGRLALISGDLARAEQLIGEAVTGVQTADDALGIIAWQPYLALVKFYQGDEAEAWRLLQTSLTRCRDLDNRPRPWIILTFLAMIALQRKDLHQAERFLRESLAHYADDRKVTAELVDCLFTAVRLAAAQQQFERAATILGLAERLRAELQHTLDAPIRPLVETAVERVHDELGAERFATAWMKGRNLSLAEAFVTLWWSP